MKLESHSSQNNEILCLWFLTPFSLQSIQMYKRKERKIIKQILGNDKKTPTDNSTGNTINFPPPVKGFRSI